MLKSLKTLTLFATAFVLFAATALATTPRVVDSKALMHVSATAKPVEMSQTLGYAKALMLNTEVAKLTFADGPAEVHMLNFPIPGNETAVLYLTKTRPVVDGRTVFVKTTKNGDKPYTIGAIQSYIGTIDGDPESKVSLHYSTGDITGIIQLNNGTRLIVGRNVNDKANALETPLAIVDERNATNANPLAEFMCGNADNTISVNELVAEYNSASKRTEAVQSTDLLELEGAFAIREDIDVYCKQFSISTEQATEYFVKIVAAMSQVYEQELNTVLTISYFVFYTEDEPTGYVNTGEDPGALLQEFSRDWSRSRNDVERDFAHMYTRKVPKNGSYVGGIAYGGGMSASRLCRNENGGAYGVSTVDFQVNSVIPGVPTASNAFVWDVFVAAHEIGHNIGAAHTHSCAWAPPVDTCQLSFEIDGTDGCYSQTSLRRVRPGTIMSYCHLVNGSTTPLTFGERPAAKMRQLLETSSCVAVVTAPQINITEPRGAEELRAGQTKTIKWTSAGVGNVKIEYQPRPTAEWVTIVGSVAAADKQYNWLIPSLEAPELIIRVSDATNAAIADTSISRYSIRSSITITSPTGGLKIAGGVPFPITFVKLSSVGACKIEFSANGGETWENVVASISETTYSWNVPSIVTDKAKIRISSPAVPNSAVETDMFSIGTRTFSLQIPVEGADFCNNVQNQFSWTGDFLPALMRIQWSRISPVVWRAATQATSVPPSPNNIFSLSPLLGQVPAGTKIKLRIVDSRDTNQVLAVINELNIIECTVGIDERTEQNGYRLTSVSPNPATTEAVLAIDHVQPTTVSVLLLNSAGELINVLQNHQLAGSGTTNVRIPTATLASGTYQILAKVGGYVLSSPLTIVR